ncbi:hypothetical protein EYF80_016168 [Liparis tanakae]|uniref:Uncharacterized protein n=1 Tax=Liparis tanakae TaxID=230148 RepID=A0A4Z2I8Y5_9TELE|nr:hypothetical protein EYF80_016168 [Liparis tanakae]
MSCQGIAAVNGSGSLPVMLKPPGVTSGERWARSEARLRKRSRSPQRGQRKGRSQEVVTTFPRVPWELAELSFMAVKVLPSATCFT